MPIDECALIDSHCHPHFPPLADDIAALRAQMAEHNVATAVAVATKRAEFPVVCQLAADYPGEFYAACGVHPKTDEDISASALAEVCAPPAVLAVGETGLDYSARDGECIPRATQQRRFAEHIEAARLAGKPLIIHTRDSLDDTLALLAECRGGEIGGVFHCYTGDINGARRILDLNFHLSFTGIVSFKNAAVAREAAGYVPADRYMVETDSPYLAPVPYRGKVNTPGYVRYVAGALAALRGCSEAQIAAESGATFRCLFKC